MKNKFVAKKKRGGLVLKLSLLVFVGILALVVTFNVLLNTSLKGLLGDEELASNLFTVATNQKNFLNLDLLNPSNLLTYGLNYKLNYEPPIKVDELKLLTKHENSDEPLVYIYSSHDTETYDSPLASSYNIQYNVTVGNYILSDYLKDLGIPNYVEKESMVDYLRANGLNYNHSYYASRYYIEKRRSEYPSIKMILDVHRDALPRYASLATIDGRPCAKVTFIVAIEYENFEKNVEFAESVNAALPEGISRGLSKGNGWGANGYFNQELMSNALLIEVGGTENTIEEVANTMEYLASAIFQVLSEGE